MRISNHPKRGFTLVEIMIVVAIIGMLATMALPAFVKSRQQSVSKTCINNLRQIDGAIQEWALETGKTTGDPVTANDVAPYMGRRGTADDVYCLLAGFVAGTPCNGFNITVVGTPPTDALYDAVRHPARLQ
jgi:prepilin-type N-terminal cleavage/methylation domain-containing protein